MLNSIFDQKYRNENDSPCVFVLFFTVSSLQELFGGHLRVLLTSIKQLPNSSRSEETVKSKTKTQGE